MGAVANNVVSFPVSTQQRQVKDHFWAHLDELASYYGLPAPSRGQVARFRATIRDYGQEPEAYSDGAWEDAAVIGVESAADREGIEHKWAYAAVVCASVLVRKRELPAPIPCADLDVQHATKAPEPKAEPAQGEPQPAQSGVGVLVAELTGKCWCAADDRAALRATLVSFANTVSADDFRAAGEAWISEQTPARGKPPLPSGEQLAGIIAAKKRRAEAMRAREEQERAKKQAAEAAAEAERVIRAGGGTPEQRKALAERDYQQAVKCAKIGFKHPFPVLPEVAAKLRADRIFGWWSEENAQTGT